MLLTPRQTEYKGVVYKSKCEAMFARWLELHLKGRGSIGSGFLYEPAGMSALTGWTPDFVAFEISRPTEITLCGLPCLEYTVIEYKPSRPTDTYIREFANRCKELFEEWERREWLDIAYRAAFVLQYGSVFNHDRSSIHVCSDFGWTAIDCKKDWLKLYEKEVAATRFDLQQSSIVISHERESQIARLKAWEDKRNGG